MVSENDHLLNGIFYIIQQLIHLRHLQHHQLSVNSFLHLSAYLFKKILLSEEFIDGELKNKRQCVLKAEELNGLVGNGVIFESFPYAKTGTSASKHEPKLVSIWLHCCNWTSKH